MKNVKVLSSQEMHSIKGGETYMGSGNDEGGHYIIVDTGSACVKRYVPIDEFPHVH